MSNIIPANVKIPAHLAARIGQPSSLAQSIASGISSGESLPRISIKGSRFRIVENGTETVLDTTSLAVVIVGANPKLSKTFYAKAWDKDAEPTAPDCYSLDGVRPHPESTQPQNDICASCPHNAWGSKIGSAGQQLKACTDQKRLAVVSADDPTGPVYLLQVTPAALKGLNAYHKELTVRGIPAEIVKTKIGFDVDASYPKLTFGFAGFLDEDTYNDVMPLFGSDEVHTITGENQPEAVAKVSEPRKAAVTAKPKPVEVEVEEEVEEAPKPAKRGFGAAAADPAPAAKRGFSAAAADPAPAAKAVKAKPEPKRVAEVSDDVTDLADEILGMIGDADD
jgi:hypothetical protein